MGSNGQICSFCIYTNKVDENLQKKVDLTNESICDQIISTKRK